MNQINTSFLKTTILTANAVMVALAFCEQVQAAPVSLSPLFSVPTVALESGGLAGTWYKVQNDAKFSEAMWEGVTIKDTSWGTGIWAASDIAAIAADPRPDYVTVSTTTVGAVSYANNIYNNTFTSGIYGTWQADYTRVLAPPVGIANGCNVSNQDTAGCANEQNYAAVFAGFLYVAEQGLYDFGVFADDVFSFSLTGLGGAFGVGHEAVAGSPGRVFGTLLAQNSLDALTLSQGFYGIDLSYANRLEAGVIDLAWKGPGETSWRTIGEPDLYHQVPEPTTLVLLAMGLLGVWGARTLRTVAAPVLAA